MNQETQEKTKKVFYETGEKLAVTDPEFVECIGRDMIWLARE